MRRLILALSFVALATIAPATTCVVSGTVLKTDDTPCYRCYVNAEQVTNIQGVYTYAGTTISGRTAAESATGWAWAWP